jgi:hypothetical protein
MAIGRRPDVMLPNGFDYFTSVPCLSTGGRSGAGHAPLDLTCAGRPFVGERSRPSARASTALAAPPHRTRYIIRVGFAFAGSSSV